jgi:lysophospholipase L1-like esterase
MTKKIFWAGDSTVQMNTITTYPQTGIGQVFSLYTNEDIIICNFAKNGRSTKSFIQEGILHEIEKEIRQGDYLFIQFGHNDEKEDEERRTEPFTTFQDYLTCYINTARKHGAFPVMITPLYRRHFDENGYLKDNVHLEYPDGMKDLAKRLDVPIVDLCESSKKLLHTFGEEATYSWFMNFEPGIFSNYPEGSKDNTHLQHSGAVTFAGLIAKGLKQLGGRYGELLIERNDK